MSFLLLLPAHVSSSRPGTHLSRLQLCRTTLLILPAVRLLPAFLDHYRVERFLLSVQVYHRRVTALLNLLLYLHPVHGSTQGRMLPITLPWVRGVLKAD